MEGTNTASDVGDYISAGLPNIEGYDCLAWYGENSVLVANAGDGISGAFNGNKQTRSNANYYTSASTHISQTVQVGVSFDASKSNPIYGNSTTVQPNSYKVMYIIRAK